MKTIIIAAILMTLTQTAAASSMFIYCSTADGSITNISGHRWETEVRYSDRKTGTKYSASVEGAQLEILEQHADISEDIRKGECQEGGYSWGSAKSTYTILAKLKLPNNASERVREVVGEKPKVYLCERFSDWQEPCE